MDNHLKKTHRKRMEEAFAPRERVKVGIVGVDSGQVVICDPCYIKRDPSEQSELNDYEHLLELRNAKKAKTLQLKFDMGHAGLGVVADTGGDGGFPVYATIDKNTGRIEKLEVEFGENAK